MMKWVSVRSSNISDVGYDDETSELGVIFKGGATYRYSDVPEDVYNDFIQSKSLGQYLHRNIKGSYEYTRA